MNPTPDTTDQTQLLPWHAHAVLPALVPGACLSRALLMAFAQAMRDQALPVQPQRMRYDRLYALQCLCQAHSRGDEHLRALAVELFDRYQPWPSSR